MERTIARFVRALRDRGIRVSPGESLDAVHALAIGGVDGRESVRTLLRLTLVKNVNDVAAFEDVFDQFFSIAKSNPAASDAKDLPTALVHIVEGEQLKTAIYHQHEDEGPTFQIDEEGTLEDPLGLEEGADDEAGAEIRVQLDGCRAKLDVPCPSDYFGRILPTVAFDQRAGGARSVPFSPEEIADLQYVVARMVVRMRKDVRRIQERQRRGRLHVIRTLQKNYRHSMVPFLRSLRRKTKQRPRLVVLCDVSFSVSHSCRFMLLLLHTLHNRVMDVRSFLFNKELVEITSMFRNMPVNALLEAIDKGQIVNMDDNSDYGEVFLSFKKKHLENLRGKPAFIILGDGRNNYSEANDWALEEIREKAGYMLWLTPEERETWERGDCLVNLYGSYCDKVESASNVDELSVLVEELFRTVRVETSYWRTQATRGVKAAAENVPYWNYYSRKAVSARPAFAMQPSPGSSEWKERFGIAYRTKSGGTTWKKELASRLSKASPSHSSARNSR